MRISRVKLNNYVCFYDEDADWVELDSGINFVLGQNDSGKTALLDALQLRSERGAHRSSHTIPQRNDLRRGTVDIQVEFEFATGTLSKVLATSERTIRITRSQHDGMKIEDFLSKYLPSLAKCIQIRLRTDPLQYSLDAGETWIPVSPDEDQFHITLADDLGGSWYVADTNVGAAPDSIPMMSEILYNFFRSETVYKFNAIRPIPALSDTRNNINLAYDASNLPQAMDTARRKKPDEYDEFIKCAKQVFPEIRDIVIDKLEGPGSPGEYLEVYLGYYDRSLRREDLRIPLAGCGTGIGQALAMLYIVVTSAESRVIMIDEPNSFLHPRAIRELFSIFETYDHHQYIVATHSPTAIMAVQSKRILLIRRSDMVSTIESVDVESNDDLEKALREIGSRRSDIFGMDAVVWVEGKTDETCFKLIMERAGDGLPFGTNISALVNVDDLKSEQNAELAVEIYKSLSGGVGLLPSVLAFVFDGDKRGKHNKLTNSGYRIEYLPRWEYENYLIEHPAILAEVLSDDNGDEPQKYSEDQVADWIKCNRSDGKYYAKGAAFSEDTWLDDINGAKFLQDLFACVSNHTRVYGKVSDGEKITRRILELDPCHFNEIVDLIKPILPDSTSH